MFCTSCGAKNPDEAKFCKNCGAKFESRISTNDDDINKHQKVQMVSKEHEAFSGDIKILNLDDRIYKTIRMLKKTRKYIEQSRVCIRHATNSKDSEVLLDNAVNNCRIALEGYYEAIMSLYGVTEEMIRIGMKYVAYRDEIKKGGDGWKALNSFVKNNEKRLDIKDKEDFCSNFMMISEKEMRILGKTRDEGNSGSHFNYTKITKESADKTSNAMAGLIDGELVFLEDIISNSKRDRNKAKSYLMSRTCDVYEDIVRVLGELQKNLSTFVAKRIKCTMITRMVTIKRIMCLH